jgi:hypothetical protein
MKELFIFTFTAQQIMANKVQLLSLPLSLPDVIFTCPASIKKEMNKKTRHSHTAAAGHRSTVESV